MENYNIKVKLIEAEDCKNYKFKLHTGQEAELHFMEGEKYQGLNERMTAMILKQKDHKVVDYHMPVTIGVDYLIFYPNGRVEVLPEMVYELHFKNSPTQ